MLLLIAALLMVLRPLDAGCPPGSAATLAQMCPGNLLVNGGFEEPNTELIRSQRFDPNNNACWGWYFSDTVPGWYVVRPDGKRCLTVDWMGAGTIEVARAALTKPVEGRQYGELLPNATGAYCQDIKVTKGKKYSLSFWYGRLVAKAPYSGEDKGKGLKWNKGDMTVFWTAADVLMRPSSYTPAAKPGRYPGDMQGFTLLKAVNTRDWPMDNSTGPYQPIWKEYTLTFTAPSNGVTLAFVNTVRSAVCACGSLLDAVCLREVK